MSEQIYPARILRLLTRTYENRSRAIQYLLGALLAYPGVYAGGGIFERKRVKWLSRLPTLSSNALFLENMSCTCSVARNGF